MALDPSIITSGQPIKLPTLGDLVALQGQQANVQGQQQQNQIGALKLQQANRGMQAQTTLAQLYKANTNPDGTVNMPAVQAGMAQAGFGEQNDDIQTAHQRALTGALSYNQAQFSDHLSRLKIVSDGLTSLLADPALSPQGIAADPQTAQNKTISLINSYVNSGTIDPQTGAQLSRSLPAPSQLRQFLVQKGLETQDAQQQLAAMQRRSAPQDVGGQINMNTIPSAVEQAVNPNAPLVQPGPSVTKTMTPDQAALLKMKQLTTFTGDDGALLATLAEHGISLPAGMRSKEQQLATVRALHANNPGLSDDEIATKIGTGQINFNSDKKATTVAAGQEGKVSTAVNELGTFGDQVMAAAAKVPRGSFVPANVLMNMKDSLINDPNLLTLKLKLNALNQAYNVLGARGGTDATARAHVAQLFSAANSPEGYAALVKGLREEGVGAQAAAQKASHMNAAGVVNGDTAPATPVTDVPPDIAAILQKHGAQ